MIIAPRFSSRVAVCLMLTASASTIAAEPAAFDPNWVSDEFVGAVVIRTQPILDSKLMAGVAKEDALSMVRNMSFTRNGTDHPEWMVACLGFGERTYKKYLYSKGEEKFTEVTEVVPLDLGIARFAKPIDKEKVLSSRFGPEHRTIKGVAGEYYTSSYRDEYGGKKFGFYIPDDRTIIMADTGTLDLLLAGKSKTGPLAEAIKTAPADKALVLLGRGSDLAYHRIELAGKAMPYYRKSEFGPFAEMLKQTRRLDLEIDLDGPQLAKATAEMSSTAGAQQLTDLAKGGVALLKLLYAGSKPEMMQSAPPEIAPLLASVIEKALSGVAVEASGPKVAASITAIDDLPKLVKAIGPELRHGMFFGGKKGAVKQDPSRKE